MLQLKMLNPNTKEEYFLDYDPEKMILRKDEKPFQLDEYKTVFRSVFDRPKCDSSIRILLGRECNYRCSYCKQSIGGYVKEDISDDVLDLFIQNLIKYIDSLNIQSINIQPWGGEPLLYFKEMVRIIDTLNLVFPEKNISYGTVTNGSLLTDEITDFLIKNKFSVGISYDGPGQHLRGFDILKSEKIVKNIKRIYDSIPVSLNVTMTTANYDYLKFIKHVDDVFGEEYKFTFGEGQSIIPVDDASLVSSIPLHNLHEFMQHIYSSLYNNYTEMSRFNVFPMLMNKFVSNLNNDTFKIPDRNQCVGGVKHNVTFDLNGNILTCQSMPPEDIHFLGNITDDTSDIKNKPMGTTWVHREKCKNCPVLFLCLGGCAFNPEEYHSYYCEQMYYFYSGVLATTLSLITDGDILTEIHGEFFHRLSTFHKQTMKQFTQTVKFSK